MFEGIYRVKVIGTPIGAGPDDPIDGDGDGFHSRGPGTPDNIPMPPSALVKWDSVEDILDWDVIGSDPSDEEALWNFHEAVQGDWSRWNPCRKIRIAAYRLAGADLNPADPNVEREGGYFGNGWNVHVPDDLVVEQARYLMGGLARGASGPREPRRIYRAIDVDPADKEAFWGAIKEGQTVDIPLISFADRRNQGPNEFLDRYGSDVLFEVEEGAAVIEAGRMDPLYSDQDEEQTLETLNEIVGQIEDEIDELDDEDEIDWRKQQIDEIQDLLKEYADRREKDQDRAEQIRNELAHILDGYGVQHVRWSGELIPEDDGELYWSVVEADEWSYHPNSPQEKISGGRFEIISVDDDPRGHYGAVVRLRQVGVFDPQNPGNVIPVGNSKKVDQAGVVLW